MTKFNEFDEDLIKKGLDLVEKQWLKEIKAVEAKGKRSLFAVTFPAMYVKELKEKVNSLTVKQKEDANT